MKGFEATCEAGEEIMNYYPQLILM
jgi:hypothetical protein